MNKAPPINLDWIHPDRADHAEVFFAVYRPALRRHTPRDLHWSLAWAIGNTWKQLHVIEEKMADGPSPQPRYVYWGPLTKSSGPTDDVADRYFLGVFSQTQRKQIEELAAETPVMVPDGTWNCQDWLLDLFERMVDAGIINARTRDSVLKAAGYSGKREAEPFRRHRTDLIDSLNVYVTLQISDRLRSF